ncbi:site-2 protease family protein [Terrisporobacter mayombei]|uniref:Peptidase M50 domain-containing protein n=1 Tax=Terrisporobacter mayombei TaxID=1541 RepID=A0ABY9Q4A5_9FIRM|nr:site-2 protease family protein [Terrisporobacter mayombei]MCC3869044.1 hypothetical protein [Terrisporobacter mayombei]WMT82823.1 hypothetical protein TEMA_33150 [Terrisporobacter mayombei]
MKSKLIKVLPYIVGALIGLILGLNGFYVEIKGVIIGAVSIVLVGIVELLIFTTIHELSHGFVAEKNGLKFTVLYIGPFTFKRENKKFKRMKGLTKQLMYIGRAQIDNFEILNEDDIEKARKAWIKALQAGPLSDLILSIIAIVLGLIFKSYILVIATIIVVMFMCLPSYIMGDGQHTKLMKTDKIFTHVILYTYSIIGNTLVSEESRRFLLEKIEKDIVENEVDKNNLISLSLSAHSIYVNAMYNDRRGLSESINKIVEMTIKNKDIFYKKEIESSYYRNVINTAIIYEVLIEDNKEKALELYKYVQNEKHNMPGEKLDFYRVEHVLGIANRRSEILNENLMNPVLKGCEGIDAIERRINELILEKI